jgi:alpha-1,6-mannosyltransferase
MLLAGGLHLAAWAWIGNLGDLSLHITELWWALVPILLGYALAAWLVLADGGPIPYAMRIIGGIAVCSRLLLLDTTPTLSDDIYRYVWDGHVQAAGLNPYSYAPEDEALIELRNDDWVKINHAELVTVYPPVAQWFFHGVQHFTPGVTGMKAALVVCDVLLLLVLWRWLLARRQDGRRVLLYAWHPLPVLEIAGNGHVDVLGVLAVCLALLWLHQGRYHAGVWALAAAVLSKLIPILCAAAFWQHLARPESAGWLRALDPRPRLVLLWIPALVIVAYMPFLDAGASMWTGLSAYASKWRFNDSAFGLVYRLLSDPKPGWQWDDEALRTARWVCLATVALVMAWQALRRHADPAAICATVMGTQLLLSPTVHPWYLLWVLPFMVLHAIPAWIAFSWLVLLAYHVLGEYRSTGVWHESEWIRVLQYLPVYLLLAWSPLWQHLRQRPRNV